MGCYDILHKIKRKSGDDEETLRNHSLPDIPPRNDELPIKSAYSIKSKVAHNIHEEIEALVSENAELRASMGELNKEAMQVE